MITKRPGREGKVLVTFAMPAAVWADTIHVVGDFNDWNQRATPLQQSESGWMATLALDAGRAYQYRYLLNGHDWCNDWNADYYQPNAFGGDNSVVVTPNFTLDDNPEAENNNVLRLGSSRLRLVRSG